MAQLGFPTTNGTAELASLLQEVVTELADISQEIADLTCVENAKDAQNAASNIQNNWSTYQLVIEDGGISADTLTSWTTYVRGTGKDTLTNDITLIANDFIGKGSGGSLLESREGANDAKAPEKDTMDDRPAWEFTTNLTNYYANTIILGLAMQAYDAWLAEGNTADDTTTDNLPIAVCGGSPPASSDRAVACTAAVNYYTTYRGNVIDILRFGGGALFHRLAVAAKRPGFALGG